MARLFWPKFLKMFIEFRKVAKHPLFHYLPIGPFASLDILRFINMDRRIWSWGYFTQSPLTATSYRQNDCLSILWVGRMLSWKRLDTLIKALADVVKTNRKIKLTLVGDGPERIRLVKMAEKLLHKQYYEFLPSMSADKVIEFMSKHDIYVLASSSYEGWGAVVNEAMSCGCSVVSSDKCGSAAAMITNKVNGLLFKPGDWLDLSNQLKSLSDDENLRKSLGNAAISSINELWSPREAAERFYNICDALLNEREIPEYLSGPMSTAHVGTNVLTRSTS
jgi:glycosyltransferase involved in cell wall biosynthesis